MPKKPRIKKPLRRKLSPLEKWQRRRKKRPPTIDELRAAGLPLPDSKQLVRGKTPKSLMKEWYGKLKAEGFDDIEWYDAETGLGANSPYLKRADQSAIKHVRPNTFEYYRLCRCYLEHGPWKHLRAGDKLIWAMYSEGEAYRDILKAFKREYNPKRSLFYIFQRIKALDALMVEWHYKHPEGLLHDRQDLYIEDIMMREPDPVPSAD